MPRGKRPVEATPTFIGVGEWSSSSGGDEGSEDQVRRDGKRHKNNHGGITYNLNSCSHGSAINLASNTSDSGIDAHSGDEDESVSAKGRARNRPGMKSSQQQPVVFDLASDDDSLSSIPPATTTPAGTGTGGDRGDTSAASISSDKADDLLWNIGSKDKLSTKKETKGDRKAAEGTTRTTRAAAVAAVAAASSEVSAREREDDNTNVPEDVASSSSSSMVIKHGRQVSEGTDTGAGTGLASPHVVGHRPDAVAWLDSDRGADTSRYFAPQEDVMITCRKCGEGGHIARNCPNERPCILCGFKHEGTQCEMSRCFRCYGVGHMAKDCSSRAVGRGYNRWANAIPLSAEELKDVHASCYNCGARGHTGGTCREKTVDSLHQHYRNYGYLPRLKIPIDSAGGVRKEADRRSWRSGGGGGGGGTSASSRSPRNSSGKERASHHDRTKRLGTGERSITYQDGDYKSSSNKKKGKKAKHEAKKTEKKTRKERKAAKIQKAYREEKMARGGRGGGKGWGGTGGSRKRKR